MSQNHFLCSDIDDMTPNNKLKSKKIFVQYSILFWFSLLFLFKVKQ